MKNIHHGSYLSLVKRIAAATCTLLLFTFLVHGQSANRDSINAIIGPPPYDSFDLDRIDQQAREYMNRDLDIARGLAEKGIAIAEALSFPGLRFASSRASAAAEGG